MASRTETIPKDFLQHLGASIPGFSSESADHQFKLARMAWVGVTKLNQHSHFEGMMSFSAASLEDSFGRSGFDQINRRLSFFNRTPGWSQENGYTRGYDFTYDTRLAIEAYFARPRCGVVTELVMADGKTVRTVAAAIASKDKAGVTTTAWARSCALGLVKVNLDELERLKQELLAVYNTHKAESVDDAWSAAPGLAAVERVIATICRVDVWSRTAAAGLGVMPHHYTEADSGRLYPDDISLASAHGLVKDAALLGQWEYDISNCHFAIVAQMAERHGHACVSINHYLANKAAVRIQVAHEAGISVAQAKTALLALLYGARLTAWHETAIAKEIGSDAVKKLTGAAAFAALRKDIKQARAAVLSKCDRTSKGWVINAFGKTINPSKTREQQFSHLLQGVEANALKAVINRYPNGIVLVQHDGFVAKSQLDIGSLNAAVSAETGYDLKFEERQLKPDPADYFRDRL